MARNFGLGWTNDYPDTAALIGQPGMAPAVSETPFQKFTDKASPFLSAIGMALMSSPRNAPLANLPNILPGLMQERQKQEQQKREMDFMREIMARAPPSPLGVDDAPSGAPAAVSAPMDGNAGNAGQMVPGGALSRAAANAGQYEPLIQLAATQYGIPPDILRNQLRVESNFDPNAVSPAGARGIAQFMPATAQRFGIDPLDPNQAIPASAKYTASNRDKFGGNLGLGLAGYNWGEGNVQKWLTSGASPEAVPAETRKYVQNITGQPIEAWASQGGAGAPDTVLPSAAAQARPLRMVAAVGKTPQAGQSSADNAGVQYAQSQPTQRDLAQARAYMPTTPPPPSPDQVRGQRTQAAVAAKSIQYWLPALAAGSLLGDPGKGLADLAKAQIDLAKGFLTPTEMQKNINSAFPNDPAARQRAMRMALPNSPEGAYASELARDQAKLQNYGTFKGIDVQADNARETELQKNLKMLPPGQRQDLAAGAIPGNAPPAEIKEYQAYVADASRRGETPMSLFDWGQQRRKAGSTMINTGEGFDAAQTKARIQLDLDAAKEITTKANAVRQLAPVLDRVIEIANKTPEGWAGPVAAFAASAFSAAGYPITEGMSNAELMYSLNQQLIPLVRQPGQQSNLEMQVYGRAVPGLSNSAEGRLKIAELIKTMGKRADEIAVIYRTYLGKPELYEKLAELDTRPVFTDEQRRAMIDAAATPAVVAPDAPQATGRIPQGKGAFPYDDAVAKLKAAPTKTNQFYFDQVFGPGSAAKALGQ